jgi:hypothetical protein
MITIVSGSLIIFIEVSIIFLITYKRTSPR